ncbi:hypothetical protein [Nocardia wallacei]|uniref:hypothetical protein n=1 Tax=Nocardia wallacei TaxID=480035 RepID=UPI002458523A|nr:hypothetical protein [Nocardia wallacei]
MAINRMAIEYLLADGSSGIAFPTMADRIEWDRIAHQKNWPPVQNALSMWTAFLVWSYLYRTGDTKDSFEYFSTHVLDQATMTADDTAGDVDPTRTAVLPGPS